MILQKYLQTLSFPETVPFPRKRSVACSLAFLAPLAFFGSHKQPVRIRVRILVSPMSDPPIVYQQIPLLFPPGMFIPKGRRCLRAPSLLVQSPSPGATRFCCNLACFAQPFPFLISHPLRPLPTASKRPFSLPPLLPPCSFPFPPWHPLSTPPPPSPLHYSPPLLPFSPLTIPPPNLLSPRLSLPPVLPPHPP